MAAMATTPVRSNRGSELSNESPLPTPPQAMHDLIRTGKAETRRQGRDSGSQHGSSGDNSKEQVHEGQERNAISRHVRIDREPSSPSERAGTTSRRARGGGGANYASANDVDDEQARYSPGVQGSHGKGQGSLGASLGTSSSRHSQRSALGAQLGIRGETDASHSEHARPRMAPLQSPSVQEHGKRTASYESSGSAGGSTGRQDLLARDSPRHSPKSAESERSTCAGERANKENVMYGSSTGARFATRPRASEEKGEQKVHKSASPERNYATREGREASSVMRRVSSGSGNPHDPPVMVRRISDDDALAASQRRRGVLCENKSPQQAQSIENAEIGKQNENVKGFAEHAVGPSMLKMGYQTPSLSTATRGLRSGQTPRHAAAPWSVGRAIKRIDRHTAPDKPPQRIMAQPMEDEDEEEDLADAPLGLRQLTAVEEDDDGVTNRINKPREEMCVPLGADDDEEEEEGTDLDPLRKSVASRRRAAINDILAAKIPAGSGNGARHALPQQGLDRVNQQPQQVASCLVDRSNDTDSAHGSIDFMSLVQREAVQQRGMSFIEQIKAKPSKDLETKFNGFKFKKVRKAGEGGFSTVWVVQGPFAVPDATQPGAYIDVPEERQAYFAMKQVTLKKMEKVSRDEVLEECNTLQSLASKPNNEDFILRFFGWKSSTGSLKILIELGEHDFNHILRSQRLSRTQIVTYWYQMLQAVHFTHEEGNIVHTDLKPANFLMANGRLKLIDFGIAQKIPVGTIHIKRDAMIGTPNYMAPETVRAVKEGRTLGGQAVSAASSANGQDGRADAKMVRVYKAGKASDVWALGCILYQMVYCRPPFDGFHGDEKLREILDPKHRIQFPETRYGPSRPQQASSVVHGQGTDGKDGEDDGVLESVDADLLDAMMQTLTYSAVQRITIPALFDHPLLRPLEQQRRAELRRRSQEASSNGGKEAHSSAQDDDETVHMTRAELNDILRKMYAYARNGELRDDNLDARSDALFDNMRKRQHRPQKQQG